MVGARPPCASSNILLLHIASTPAVLSAGALIAAAVSSPLSTSQACMEDGVLWLRVAWVGYDLPTWITASKLNAPPGEYDFETPELRDWVVARHEALQRHSQRKRAHEEQQQQQQRKTRSRGAADGGSSSSSSSSATVSLADPLLADGYSP